MIQNFNRFKKPIAPSIIYGLNESEEYQAIKIDSNTGALKVFQYGYDGTNVIPIKVDSEGNVFVANRVLKDPISKATLLNQTITDSQPILSSYITSEYPPTLFRIYAVFDTELRLDVIRTLGYDTVYEQLNAGINLNANAAYMFDILVDELENINLQAYIDGSGTTTATLLKLSIIEIPQVS